MEFWGKSERGFMIALSYVVFFLDAAFSAFLAGTWLVAVSLDDPTLFLEDAYIHELASIAIVWRLALFAVSLYQLHQHGILMMGAALYDVAGRSIASHWLHTPAIPYTIVLFSFGVMLDDWWIILMAVPASNAITILHAYAHRFYIRMFDDFLSPGE